MEKGKKIFSALLTLFVVVFIIQLDVQDAFSHGYFTDSIPYDQIYEEDIEGYVDLTKSDYTVSFSPIKNNFVGFVMYFTNQPSGNTGTIELSVYDSNGKNIDIINVDLSKVQDRDDYKVYANKKLKKGRQYTVTISAKECDTVPNMILIDQDYITAECSDNNLLMGYAYEMDTFTIIEKTLITLFAISLLLIVLALINDKQKIIRVFYSVGIFLLLMTTMAWNYNFNTFGYKNSNFTDFDKFSESLVTTTIKANQNGEDGSLMVGLNGYTDVTGLWSEYDKSFLSGSDWSNGYHKTQSMILLRTSHYVNDMAVVGNVILFENGDQYPISEVSSDGTWTTVTLNSGRPLNWWKYGDLSKVRFIDTNGNMLPQGYFFNYVSQYGLQGKIYKHLARIFDVEFLKVLTSIATAITLLAIVYFIYYKYNLVFACVFYITFLLGPWVVDFANNLYWVEFTWFLPMLVGIFCAWKIKNRKCRILSYIAAYIFVAIKSLCGYEYISVVMMGLILFLLVDLITAFVKKNREDTLLLFRTIIIMGVVALAGFVTAMCIHAPIKPGADGSIIKGLKLIFVNDVMRRTYGADINNFDMIPGAEGYSVLASTWETFVRYFHFDTEVITGIDGSMFPILCIIPILIFVYDAKKKALNIELVAMYCVSFLTTISWFILAKSHSYIHTHLNYVLWYFGYIQVCLYVVVEKIWSLCGKLKKEK